MKVGVTSGDLEAKHILFEAFIVLFRLEKCRAIYLVPKSPIIIFHNKEAGKLRCWLFAGLEL